MTYNQHNTQRRADVRQIRHTFYVTFGFDTKYSKKFATVLAGNRLDAECKARANNEYGSAVSRVYSEREWLKHGFSGKAWGFERLTKE